MNMRDMNDLNLKDAFSPMPDDCRDALMDAARSVKEGKPMKRVSFRMALIAAAVIVALMAVAFAAGQLGLVDFFNRYYDNRLPDSAKTVLNATQQKTFTVGPLSITLRETLVDGRIAYVTTQAATADGSPALIVASYDIDMAIPDALAAKMNVPKNTIALDAARQAHVPLYTVSYYLTVDEAYRDGEEMLDILWAEDGSALLVDMLTLNPATVPETLSGTLTLHVREIDLAQETYAEANEWRMDEELTLPVSGVTAEKTYLPEGDAQLAGYTINSVKAEQTCAGVYLTATLTSPEAVPHEVHGLYSILEIQDAQGQPFPGGINLSGRLNGDAWPTVIWESMIGLDTLPESLQILCTQDGKRVTLK